MRRLDKALDAAAQEISVTRTADDYDNAVVVDSGP